MWSFVGFVGFACRQSLTRTKIHKYPPQYKTYETYETLYINELEVGFVGTIGGFRSHTPTQPHATRFFRRPAMLKPINPACSMGAT